MGLSRNKASVRERVDGLPPFLRRKLRVDVLGIAHIYSEVGRVMFVSLKHNVSSQEADSKQKEMMIISLNCTTELLKLD